MRAGTWTTSPGLRQMHMRAVSRTVSSGQYQP